jgi:hypothetical protein
MADQTRLEECHLRAQQVAALFRLPFRRRTWHGLQGNWQGAGTGSSLDFQDHRPYTPGDDPRYINWQAYARSGHYTMKLYRQEVSPAMDVLLDSSASMFNGEAKMRRVAELLYWAIESGIGSGAALRIFRWIGTEAEPLAMDEVVGHRWMQPKGSGDHGAVLPNVPWRQGSLRVILSDLLWPGDAAPFFQRVTEGNGFAVVLAPFSPDESEPKWKGNMEMHDCESSQSRAQRVAPGLLEQYGVSYRRHFALWEDQALRYHVPMARVSSEGDLAEAFRIHAGESGAIEWAS